MAYVLCGDEPITPERFRAILQAKGVLDKLFRLVDKEAAGVVTPGQIMDFLAQVSASRPKAGFDQGSLEWLETLFRQTVGDKKEISLDDFNKIVHSKNVSTNFLLFLLKYQKKNHIIKRFKEI